MHGKDEISIGITFVIGLIGGFYFFLTGYAPYVEEIKEVVFTDDQDNVKSLVIIGKQYGGCDIINQCASFQLEYDGSYSYLTSPVSEGAVPEQGILSKAILGKVRTVIVPSTLYLASAVMIANECVSYVDGIDYSYEIIRGGELFVLDTCTTDLNKYPEILETLNIIWDYVGNE